MRKMLFAVIGLLLLQLATGGAAVAAGTAAAEANNAQNAVKVLVAYQQNFLDKDPQLLAGYESVLQEEGVPYAQVNVLQLTAMKPVDAAKRVPAVILPDGLLQNVPQAFATWVRQYVAAGGNVAIIYDVGVKDAKGFYLDKAALAELVGLNYMTYSKLGAEAYATGNIRFSSTSSRDFFQIPFGKTVEQLTLSSYGYGALTYPIARNEAVRPLPASAIYAYGVTEKQEEFPALVVADVGKGKALYVNLPLGYLKAYSDDLPMRAILRTFLFDVVGMPHLLNVPYARGGLVINWHVDSDIEHVSLPYLLKKGVLRKEIPASIHITAGDFFLTPHDNAGFDADHWGKKIVLQLKDYGVIGSHGGWAHNWFSGNISKGIFKDKEIRENIVKNNESLEKIIGYKITEYSAPNGVHPQPVATEILQDLGVIAYYYTGDSGSAPNRVFHSGKMVSDQVIAFPIMPFGKSGSIGEMKLLENKPAQEVGEWYTQTLNYVIRNRTMRLIYTHPYDFQHYPQAMTAFFDRVVFLQSNKEIAVQPMSEYAKFLLRFLKTTAVFSQEGKKLVIRLANPEGLGGISVAVPKQGYARPEVDGIAVQEDERYYYLVIEEQDGKEKQIVVDSR